MRWLMTLLAATVVLLPGLSRPVHAAIGYSTITTYRTGQDPYHPNPDFGLTGATSGTISAALDYSGAGTLTGVFSYFGSAQSAVGSLRARTAVTLTDYALGSYVMVDTPVYDYLPESGFAQSSVTDQVVVSGAAASYDVQFTYHLTGTATRPSPYESWFLPLVYTSTSFMVPGTGSNAGFAGTVFYPETGPYDATIVLTARDVASNVAFDLRQTLQVKLYSADRMYTTNIDPYLTGDWDPSHITSVTNLVGNPYSVSFSGDFSNTLTLQNVSILDAIGDVADGASLRSDNGVSYPGQPSAVPEPSMLALTCAGLAVLAIRRRHGSRSP